MHTYIELKEEEFAQYSPTTLCLCMSVCVCVCIYIYIYIYIMWRERVRDIRADGMRR